MVKSLQDEAEGLLATYWPREWPLSQDQKWFITAMMATFAYSKTANEYIELLKGHYGGSLKEAIKVTDAVLNPVEEKKEEEKVKRDTLIEKKKRERTTIDPPRRKGNKVFKSR